MMEINAIMPLVIKGDRVDTAKKGENRHQDDGG